MRKMVITLLALGVFAASTAFAANFWSETFPYAAGGLVAVSGGNWTTHSGTPPIDIQVVSGEAVVNSANAPDDNRQFTPPQSTTASTYACFRLAISGTQTAGGTYFAHLMNNGTLFAARVFAMLNDATTYQLAIGTSSTAPLAGAIWPTPLTKGVYYDVTVKYDAFTGYSTMWVNPTSEASPSVISSTAVTGTPISGFGLRQASGYGVANIDNIGVGNTFLDACVLNPVPANSNTWGQLKSLYR